MGSGVMEPCPFRRRNPAEQFVVFIVDVIEPIPGAFAEPVLRIRRIAGLQALAAGTERWAKSESASRCSSIGLMGGFFG